MKLKFKLPGKNGGPQDGESTRARYARAGKVVAVIILIACAVPLLDWVVWRIGHVTSDAAYVKAEIANVAPEVPGKIVKVLVQEGETVKRGQILMRIDPDQLERRVAASEAELAAAISARERYQADYLQVSKAVPAAVNAAKCALDNARHQEIKVKAHLEFRQKQHKRYKTLLESAAVSRAKYDEIETALKAASADAEAAAAEVRLAEAKMAEAETAWRNIEKIAAARREASDNVRRMKESLSMSRLNRTWCDIASPIDGVVARKFAETGDYATPGRPVISLYNPETRYVEARVEESKLGHLGAGKKVDLSVDRMPGKKFTGRVLLQSPASAAEFALIPRDVTAGEFTKVAQRVPVKIAVDHIESHPELVPGLSVEIAVKK